MTQTQSILSHLRNRGSITPLEALNEYGCFRLAARINDLKREGHDIKSEPWKTPGGASVARYSLADCAESPELHQPVLFA